MDRGEKILLVEDNDSAREIIALSLQRSGFIPVEANNGLLGLELFYQHRPELVLLDLRMPGMDGLDVLEALTEASPETPVIIISGVGTTDDIIKALRLGAWDYVTKPILDYRVLEHAVNKGLERRKLLCENLRYRRHLEDEVSKRTTELEKRSRELEKAYRQLILEVEDRRQTEEALRDSEAKLRVLLNAATDPIVLMDSEGTILDINESMSRNLGGRTDQLLGLSIWQLPHTMMLTKSMFHEVINNGSPLSIEKEYQGRWHDIAIYPIYDSSRKRITKIAVFLRDITTRKWTEEELRELTITDELTGLFNRRGIMTMARKQLKIAERSNNQIFLLYIDFDNMKAINDQHGHVIGDQALIETASILKDTFREADVIGRLGGDEFIVVLTDSKGNSDEHSVVKRLEEKINARNEQQDKPYKICISTGTIRHNHASPCTIEELIAQGDALMYENKLKKRKRHKVNAGLLPHRSYYVGRA